MTGSGRRRMARRSEDVGSEDDEEDDGFDVEG